MTEDLMNPVIQPYANLYVNRLNSTVNISNIGQSAFTLNSAIVVTGASYNPSAQTLLNNIFHHGEAANNQFNLPTRASLYSYLNTNFGISNPPPLGFTFKFSIANKSANTLTLSSSLDSGWKLNFCINGSTATDAIMLATTAREFTCIVGSAPGILSTEIAVQG